MSSSDLQRKVLLAVEQTGTTHDKLVKARFWPWLEPFSAPWLEPFSAPWLEPFSANL